MDKATRLFQLAQLLAGAAPKTLQELADRFEVSPRTVRRDLSELSRRCIPVTRDDESGRYRLLESATIRPLALTAAEHAALKLVLANPAVRATRGVGNALELVEAKLDMVTRRTEETRSALTLAGPERSGAIPPARTELLESAVRERRPVTIHYRSLASRRQSWRGLDPYEVFHRESAWYLIGRCHVHDEPRVFRLDRIVEAKTLDGHFECPDFDVEDYLRHVWAIFRGRELHEVVVHFDAAFGPLLEGGVHHAGERVERLPNGDLEYRVSLSHLHEIACWIIGFAGQARAVAPPALVRLVADIAHTAWERHGEAAEYLPPPGPLQNELPGLAGPGPARQRSLKI